MKRLRLLNEYRQAQYGTIEIRPVMEIQGLPQN